MSALPNPDLPTLALLDELATPVVLVDVDAIVAYVNPAAASWLGVSARRLVAQPAKRLFGVGLPGGLDLEALVAERAPRRIARVALSPAPGVERYAELRVTPLSGDQRYACALELHEGSEFRGVDAEQDLPAALQVALKGLAHEVKNPLAGLRGAAQLLARRLAEAEARSADAARAADARPSGDATRTAEPRPLVDAVRTAESRPLGDAMRYLDVITAEADRLVALVDRLLDPTPARAPVPVNVHEVLERVRLLAEADAGWSVVVQRDYDPSLPTIAADPDRLTQAAWNLVRNALQAGSTQVRLRTRAEHNVAIGDGIARLALRIDVIDDGHGVDDALGNRILLPLVSGRADGTGLGLPLAHAVAREHGGSLTFRSRPGHTVFTLLLPVPNGDA